MRGGADKRIAWRGRMRRIMREAALRDRRITLVDELAAAAAVLWSCGLFSTAEIAELLMVREDAVDRTLRMGREAPQR